VTLVGHTLTGAAVGVAVLPKRAGWVHKILHQVVFMLLANLPDLPLVNWGHDKYFYSHSVFVNILFIIIGILFLTYSKNVCTKIGGWPTLAGGAIAWLSHLLLDSFYNHGKGVMIYWPLSTGRLILPIPWLAPVATVLPPYSPKTIQVFMIEFLTFAPFLLIAILIRIFDLDKKVAGLVASRIHLKKS